MTVFQPDRTWIDTHQGAPLAIAHRGASAYAFDNTLRAFETAHELGADMWEVDIRLTSDGVPVAFHDADLAKVCGLDTRIGEVSAARLADLTAAAGRPAPRFEEVAALAARYGAGIYLDAKEGEAATKAIDILLRHRVEQVIVGANTPGYCADLIARGSPYPVSILVGVGIDPFPVADACGAGIVHPCWERAGDRPDALLDAAFFAEANRRGLPVVTWHEERADVIEALVRMPVLGICSDQPEMVARHRRRRPSVPEIVCHRGACRIAPENTLAAAKAAWSAGFEIVEIDVRETADGHLVVHHDADLARTTTGVGPVADKTAAELSPLDAGGWFDGFFVGERVPRLDEVIAVTEQMGGGLYVELKQAEPLRTVEAVLSRLPADDVFFWSWNTDWLSQVRRAFAGACLMARAEDFETLEDCLAAFGANIVEFNPANADPAAFRDVRAAGGRVMIAYMGDDSDEIDRLLQLQPDLVNVNEPYLVARRLTAADRQEKQGA
jgi:glycerophosphoryl diester phosphodiesterase